jgi:hypothetical protein
VKTKTCTKCRVEKGSAEFHRKGDGLHSWCRECQRAYGREDYRTNPERRERMAKRARLERELIRSFVENHLREHPCVDCGETDLQVLEFDHVRGEKVAAISAMRSWSLATLVAEVQKCDVRCGNCHRRKTARERNWWIWRAAQALERGGSWS